jgi:hypothetical protein
MALGRDDDRHPQSGEHPDSKAIDHEHSMPVTVGRWWPVLSEIQAWDVTHLENAARDWTATAELWECVPGFATRGPMS